MFKNFVFGLILFLVREKNIQFVEYKGKICGLVKNNRLNLCNKGIRNISRIKGLRNLINLKALDLSKNSIKKINGLENLNSLRVLNLRKNQNARIEGQ